MLVLALAGVAACRAPLVTAPVEAPGHAPPVLPPSPAIPADDAIVRVSVGDESACVVRASGALMCWGSNRFGQVGDGTLTARDTPVRVEVPGGVRDVSVGYNRACAITTAGRVACWGSSPRLRGPPARLHPSLDLPGCARSS